VQESLLYERWKNLAIHSDTIHCGSDTLQVIDAGQLNCSCGPDFRNARFRLNGVIYQGDVECHCRSRDWYHHQHHLDRSFANVLLHIIPLENGPAEHVHHQQSNHNITTVAIPLQIKKALPISCRHKQFNKSTLQELGLKRFRLKMHNIAGQISVHSPEQIFYEILLRALGYSANAEPFQMLAQRLPWSWLRLQLEQVIPPNDLLAVYAGIAGFFNATSKDPFLHQMIQCFQKQQYYLDAAPLQSDAWTFAAIRPFNHPHFRLAGWVALVQAQANPLTTLRSILEQRQPTPIAKNVLNKFFSIPCSSYWQAHYGFGLPRKGRGARFFFGASQINEILQNLLLPLFAVMAQKSGSIGFLSYLEELYCQLPANNGYNVIRRRFPLFFQSQKQKPALALYQGLLYLNQCFCDSGKCDICPINSK